MDERDNAGAPPAADAPPAYDTVLPVSKLKVVRMTLPNNDPYSNASAPAGPMMASDHYANASAPLLADAPPVYGSLFPTSESAESGRTSSKKGVTYAAKICQRFCESFACLCCLLLLAVLPLTILIVGLVQGPQSPVQFFTITFGAAGLFHTVLCIFKFGAKSIAKKWLDKDGNKTYQNYITGGCTMCDILFILFFIGWIIAWTIVIIPYVNKPCDSFYYYPCNATSSFVSLMVLYSLVFLFCCGCCCFISLALYGEVAANRKNQGTV